MEKIQEAVGNFNEGMITSRELVGQIINVLGEAYEGCTFENESEAIAKLAQDLANKLQA